MMKMTEGMISVCIPAFQEKDRLPSTLAEIEVFMRENPGLIREVVISDDGSKDATVERAMRWMRRLPLRVERLAENQGKWAAIRHAISVAKGPYVLLLDADGSASIDELGKIDDLQGVMERGEAVVGSRFIRGAVVEGKSAMRRLISRGYKIYVAIWYFIASGSVCVSDTQAPFKLLPLLRIPVKRLKVDRFAGDFELLLNLEGVVMREHPLQFVHKAGSKLPMVSMFSMAWETAKVAMRWRFGKR